MRLDALYVFALKRGKLGFLGGSKATLELRKQGEKPVELAIVTKEATADAVRVLDQGLSGRVQIDPKLRG